MGLVQVFLNGLILVYDWPDWTLLVTSGLALAAAGYALHAGLRVKEPLRTVTLRSDA